MRRMGNVNLSTGEITHVTVIISELCLKTHFRIPPTLAKLTNSQLEEIHNINGHCENENTYFLFFPMSVSTHHIPDDGQDEKLKELI